MLERKSLTLNGFTGPFTLLLLLGVAAAAVSIYLTGHYFDVHFPTSVITNSACDINSFLNCDGSTLSPASTLFGVPISTFGLIYSFIVIIGCIFPSKEYEESLHLLSYLNVIACLGLLLYTLIALQSLCPFCSLYWLTSLIILFLLYKNGRRPAMPKVPVLIIWSVLASIIIGSVAYNLNQNINKQKQMSNALIHQFNSLPDVGEPINSKHILHQATPNFADSPIRMTEFSDLQCPACKRFYDIKDQLIKHFKDKISIQFFFYPLDSQCNTTMKRQLHPFACQASYLAHCAGDKFAQIHDEIFSKQSNLSQSWINKKAEQLGITECKNSEETKEVIKKHLEIGNKYEVQSTPTFIINGKKLPGVLPLQQYILLFEEILKKK